MFLNNHKGRQWLSCSCSTGSSNTKSNCRFWSWDKWRLVQQWEWERKKTTNSSQWKRANNSNIQWWRWKWWIKVWKFLRCELRRFTALHRRNQSTHNNKKKKSAKKQPAKSKTPNKHQIQKRKEERKFKVDAVVEGDETTLFFWKQKLQTKEVEPKKTARKRCHQCLADGRPESKTSYVCVQFNYTYPCKPGNCKITTTVSEDGM